MYNEDVEYKEGEKLNKKLILITSDVIEECLCESLDSLEKRVKTTQKINIIKSRTRRPLK
ncbi:hypothetical protein [Clostridium drakei]|uniref:hypothetical protein n=1 Tax=Clostridium drakei TaxID=332101 RepID=UPI000B0BA566|nr:hypothetical protein [Clostridium drakei]